VLSGRILWVSLLVLLVWLTLLVLFGKRALMESPSSGKEKARARLSPLAFCAVGIAVAALLTLHMTWVSPTVSQKLGGRTVTILSYLIFYPSILGLFLAAFGSGKWRWGAFASSVFLFCWWFALATVAGISMGAVLARHPTSYLIPMSYVGWVRIEHTDDAAPLEFSKGRYICRVPSNGVLRTSSPIEDGWAQDEYFYYSEAGNLRQLRATGWGEGGMIWGNRLEQRQGSRNRIEFFYVGSEQDFRRNSGTPGS